jgi:integrase
MKNPTYLTKNRFSIYYFQYSYTDKVGRRKLIRKSLKTRNPKEALEQARYLWLQMKTIHKKYFSDSEIYGKAMSLLARYEEYQKKSFSEVEPFLDEIDDEDNDLLTRAINQKLEEIPKNNTNSKEHYFELLTNLISHKDSNKSLNSVPSENNPLMSECVQGWLTHKKTSVKDSTYTSYTQHIDIFENITNEIMGGDYRVRMLSEKVIREFESLLKRLPANRNSRYHQKLKVKELIELKVPKIAAKTYHGHINTTIDFLTWLELQGYIDNTKLKTILQSSKKSIPKKSASHRVDFSDEDLKNLFSFAAYRNGSFRRASLYWVPLIALFSGARLGEICQLTVSDIRDVDGTPCIDINEDDEGKSIKSAESSKRLFPIHKTLLDLDFLGYVEEIKKKKQTKLFPFEQRDLNMRFHYAQKQISNYISKCGIISTQNHTKTFHSFRHTVRTRLVDLNIEERTIDGIVGHSSNERSIGMKVYTHSTMMKQKIEAMNKLQYPIEFNLIRQWRFCKFKELELDIL